MAAAASLIREKSAHEPTGRSIQERISTLMQTEIDFMLGQARAIRDHIIQANLRLVMSIVKKFVTPSQSFDELLSEGTVTLMQAVEKFDFDRGF